MGALVGRYANRIAGARIRLSGRVHDLDANERPNCLHGGTEGASVRLWRITRAAPDAVTLALDFADGEMGFPGAMQALANLSLGDHDGHGVIQRRAAGDGNAPRRPVTWTHHGYWTLSPDGAADQMLRIDADRYLPVDDALIPLPDAPAPVTGTRFDFRTAGPLGDAGLDHCWCPGRRAWPLAAGGQLTAPDLRLAVLTTAPGLQVYDGGHFPQTGLPATPARSPARKAPSRSRHRNGPTPRTARLSAHDPASRHRLADRDALSLDRPSRP